MKKRKHGNHIPFHFLNFLYPAHVKVNRGMSLIDVIVGTSIVLMVFLGIFGAFQISIELVYSTKAKTGAVALMNEQLEYIRSLSYGEVGTQGGIPAGDIPQLEQKKLNGVMYIVRTLVQYTDAPEDGLGAADRNGITADYKTVKVEVSWSVKRSARSTFAVTRVAPVGQETLEDGGTLRINVFNQNVAPVDAATVRVVNRTIHPVIDVSARTNIAGTVSFPGAPEGSGYEIYISKEGYSSAQTYGVSVQNPNPSPIHVSIVESETTTASFAIDRNGTLRFFTYKPAHPGSFNDSFANESQLATTSNISAVSGALVLTTSPASGYAPSGSALSVSVSPQYLSRWERVLFSTITPQNTALFVRVYYFNGSIYTLVPDNDLPGNSGGFSGGTIDISTVPIDRYTSLRLGVDLSTSNTTVTPELLDWSVSYLIGLSPLPNVSLAVHGTKIIGTDSGGLPLYKYNNSIITGLNGQWLATPIEWDAYAVALSDLNEYDIVERCPHSVSLQPAETLDVSLILGANTTNSLRIAVTDSAGVPVNGANVNVTGPQSLSGITGTCGQVYFGGIPQGTYTVTIQKTGFQTSHEDVGVSRESEHAISLLRD